MSSRGILALAAIFGATGVAAGAFGAHALANRLSAADLAIFETAARYQMYHAVALLGLGAWIDRRPSPRLSWAARLWIAGILVFSGSLYLLVLTQLRWLGAITPFGGTAMILGWVLLAVDAIRSTPKASH